MQKGQNKLICEGPDGQSWSAITQHVCKLASKLFERNFSSLFKTCFAFMTIFFNLEFFGVIGPDP